jgi:protein-L-isoaspartate(D-aspartate) O-methyltransferase
MPIRVPRQRAMKSRPEYALLRRQMVHDHVAVRGISDPRVLAAMEEVPREEFVPLGLRGYAYEDRPLPIGAGQTISQPYTVAYMCEAARIRPTDHVLEIGTGSGYGAAVLANLAQAVYTMERISDLAAEAHRRLESLGYNNVGVCAGDGTTGLADQAPFDAVLVTAGAQSVPPALLEQLAEGGRLIIPIGEREGSQTMYRFTRHADRFDMENLGEFAFVPLVAGGGENEDSHP